MSHVSQVRGMYKRLILFGDSITQFGSHGLALLQDRYQRRLDVVNRGFSGYNSNHAVVLLPKILEQPLDLIVIFFGTNDAAFTKQHVDVEQYTKNIEEMVRVSKRHAKVVVVGPGLHDKNWAIANKDINFSTNGETRRYSAAAKAVAMQEKVPFVDLWEEMKNAGGWLEEALLKDEVDIKRFLSDGIHYTPEAYKLYFEALARAIDKYPEFKPELIPMVAPPYSELLESDYKQRLEHALER